MLKTICSIGAILLILVVAIFFITGNNTTQEPRTVINYEVKIPTTQQTIEPVKPITPVKTITVVQTPPPVIQQITTTRNPEWTQYLNTEDQFLIYRPDNWKLTETNYNTVNAFLEDEDKIDTTNNLPSIVYLNTPDQKGMLFIYGADFANTIYENFGSSEYITDSRYNMYFDYLVKGFDETSGYSNVVLNKDPVYYKMTGNPARRITGTLRFNGVPSTIELYIIEKQNTLYVETYIARTDISSKYNSDAQNIMKSFTIY